MLGRLLFDFVDRRMNWRGNICIEETKMYGIIDETGVTMLEAMLVSVVGIRPSVSQLISQLTLSSCLLVFQMV